jgi:choline kinase
MIEHAVILAAGLGSRLKHKTTHIPKCLVQVNNTTILENTLDNLAESPVKHCTIVIGYRAKKIVERIGNRYRGLDIDYIENTVYKKTNDMYSLWLARETIQKGALLIEGDIFLKRGVINAILTGLDNRSYYVTGPYRYEAHNILVAKNRDDKITEICDSNSVEECMKNGYVISAGMLVIQKSFSRRLIEWLDSYIGQKNYTVYYDTVISEHIHEFPLFSYTIDTESWIEIDTLDDLKRAEKQFVS